MIWCSLYLLRFMQASWRHSRPETSTFQWPAFTGYLQRRPQVLEETAHFRRWRQEEVAKIVQCGEHSSFINRSRRHPRRWPEVFGGSISHVLDKVPTSL